MSQHDDARDGNAGTGDETHDRYVGKTIAGGRYRLEELLGAGGMASVHLAYDAALDRRVAIKTLHTDLGREPAFRERFRREAQAVAKLSHPHIVSVFDTGEDQLDGVTTPYIVMEYIEGDPLGTLFERDVRAHGAMPAPRALKITGDVLAALELSHEMGLVHRDIKPGNVMVNRRGVVKVMDFGIARAIQSGVTSMTQTGMVVGTPQYLSPEQALGRPVDARSDIYSVGVMLFQLLTGRLPFDADSPFAIAYAHVQEQPPVPSTLNSALTPAIDALLARALRKNPAERFPHAEAMREECERVAAAPTAPSVTGAGGQGGSGGPQGLGGGAGGPDGSGAGHGVNGQAGQAEQAIFPPVPQQGFPPAPQPQAFGTPSPAYGSPQGGGYQSPPPNPYGQPAPYGNEGAAYGGGRPSYGQGSGAYGYPQTAGTGHGGNGAGGLGGATGGGGPKPGRNARRTVLTLAVAAVVLVGGLGVAFWATGKKDEPDRKPVAKESGAHPPGYRSPETDRTLDPDKCVSRTPLAWAPDKVMVPDVQYKYLKSAEECLRAGGWKWTVEKVDNNTFGEGTVIRQKPDPNKEVDKEDKPSITLRVSTGNPA
ncbi:protein kinase domain-containing protein [Streptomyces sp. NRRL F-5630]|uniref:protein kinase domain-containing protein n=1 Tax=unclassified Streptomyces TaxID=2593676 RepID=UPI0004C84AC3|nr:protein kinase [Streptomyces sp. NRRL F-5630]